MSRSVRLVLASVCIPMSLGDRHGAARLFVVGGCCDAAVTMSRHTTFRFCLDPTGEQCEVLARHAGASRFAFNQCLRIVKTGLTARKTDPAARVPWSGFDLINTFNAWKKTDAAGRVFTVDVEGNAQLTVTGLPWRSEVCQQVFEEAAVDLGRALTAWSDSRAGTRSVARVGFPRFKKKTATTSSFRLRNRHPTGGRPAIRVGDGDRPRSVTLPGIGQLAVHDDTRRLRGMLAKERAKILFATVSRRAGRWWVSLNVEAADLHPAHHHASRADGNDGGWVGVDRGLSTFLVAATSDGTEVARITDAPRHWPPESDANGDCRSRCPASRRDHTTAVMPPPGWRVTIIGSPTCAVTSCTRYRMRWSRPTTGSSSKTSTCPECCTITISPERSPMPVGPSSPAWSATNRPGAAVRSCWLIGGIRPASDARTAGPCAPS